MLNLGPIIKKNDISKFLSVRRTHPEDCKNIPVEECILHTLYVPEVGDVQKFKIKGHIGSSAWFEGMNRYHEPVTVAHETITGQTIFWRGNNNNGVDVVFCPNTEEISPEFIAFAMSPHHKTWQPNKVILFKFESAYHAEKKLQLYRETLDLLSSYASDRNKAHRAHDFGGRWHKKILSGPTVDIVTYLATAGHFRHGSYSHYIRAANFLRRCGFDIPWF